MFTCDVGGGLNRVVHFYHYKDFDQRDAMRAAAAKDPRWSAFVAESRKHVAAQVRAEPPFRVAFSARCDAMCPLALIVAVMKDPGWATVAVESRKQAAQVPGSLNFDHDASYHLVCGHASFAIFVI